MVKEDKSTWKSNYFLKLGRLLGEYPKCFVVCVDNVGSLQMQKIRGSLRGKGEVLMGKNTMIKKAIRGYLADNPDLEKLVPFIVGNVGFVFTHEDLTEVRDMILSNRVPAAARAGALAPVDVLIPAQQTQLGPEKTNFFQALNITTKITRGTIEILNDVKVINKDEKVNASAATLLNMLSLMPFSYGLKIEKVYDSGTVYSPKVLDITPADLQQAILAGIGNIAALSLGISYPTPPAVVHLIANGVKNAIAIALETEVELKESEQVKEFLADPSKFAAAAAAAPVASQAPAEEKKEEKKKEESDEESDDGAGMFDLFGED